MPEMMTAARKIFLMINALMGILLIFAAVLQHNDPDPLPWMAVYLAASGVCFLKLAGRGSWMGPAGVCLVCLCWAGTILPGIWGQFDIASLFEQWEMRDSVVEESREFLGLLIIAGWMAVLACISKDWRKR